MADFDTHLVKGPNSAESAIGGGQLAEENCADAGAAAGGRKRTTAAQIRLPDRLIGASD